MNIKMVNSTYRAFRNTTTGIYRSNVFISPIWSLEYSIMAVMISALAVMGIMGNIPVLIVFYRRRDNLASHTFIKILAFIDLLVCAFVMPYTIVYELHIVTSDIACRFCEFIRHFTLFASALTLVAIARERYVAVCQLGNRPDVKSINIGVWVILGLSGIFSSPAIGAFAVVLDSDVQDIKCRFPHEYTSGTFCHFTYTLIGKTLVTSYQILQVVVCFSAVIVVTVLYSIIYFVLWKKSLLRRKMIARKSINSDIDSSSEVSYGIQLRRTKMYCNSSSISDRFQTAEPSVPNDKSNSEKISNGACEYPNSQHNEEEGDEFRNGTGYNNRKHTRRKIRFSVSAQSGRSEKLKQRKQYHKRTAKMLFLCTVIFLVTWMPFWFDVFGLTHCLILRYMFFIGNATNPIVYGIVNDQVRRAFKRLFFDCISKWFRFGAQSAIISSTNVRPKREK